MLVTDIIAIVRNDYGEESAETFRKRLGRRKYIGLSQALDVLDQVIGTPNPVMPSFGRTSSRSDVGDLHFAFPYEAEPAK